MKGNALLELLLVLPLAMLFLFSATDIGLRYLEDAKVNDIIRSSSSEVIVSVQDLLGTAQQISRRIEHQLLLAKRGLGYEQGDVLVEVAAVELAIKPATGELQFEGVRFGPLVPSSLSSSRILPYSDSEFRLKLLQRLATDSKKQQSLFAVPSGIGDFAKHQGQLFRDRSFAVLISVKTVSKAMNRQYTKLLFGEEHRVSQVQLLPIRNFLL